MYDKIVGAWKIAKNAAFENHIHKQTIKKGTFVSNQMVI